jgi:ribonuclease BN (tRNA processing enzyme)
VSELGQVVALRGIHQTCILVDTGDRKLLIDCGMTGLAALGAVGMTPAQIDAVIVARLHGDHFGGVPLILLDATLHPRSRPPTIAGPADTRERVKAALQLFGWASANVDAARFVALRPRQTAQIAGCEVTAFKVEAVAIPPWATPAPPTSSGAPHLLLSLPHEPLHSTKTGQPQSRMLRK